MLSVPLHMTTSFSNDDPKQSAKNDIDQHEIILESTLELDGKDVHAYITEKLFCWAFKIGKTRKPLQSITLAHIFMVCYEHKKDRKQADDIELFPTQYFSVHFVRKLKNHKLKYHCVIFHTSDSETCQQWVETIQSSFSIFSRPKQLLIFINPVGGRRMAQKIFREKVAPLFDIAKIHHRVVVTEHQDHAKEILTTEDLSTYDGVISVGGDGMFSEVLNGVLHNKDGDHTMTTNADGRPLFIGIIPAGSTDTVVFCTSGTNDPTTAALNIILGKHLSLDVCSVSSSSKFIKYSISLMGYGYFGDLMKESEKLRWLGPKRYEVAGFKRIVVNKSYEGEISLVGSSTSKEGVKCMSGCKQCSTYSQENFLPCKEDEWQTVRGRFLSVIGTNISCRCARSSTGLSPHAHLGDGYINLILVRKTTRAKYLQHLIKVSENTTDHFNFNFIDVYRVKEFKFHSIATHHDNNDNTSSSINDNGTSVWNVDGEVVDVSDLHIRVHRQLVTLYAPGIDA